VLIISANHGLGEDLPSDIQLDLASHDEGWGGLKKHVKTHVKIHYLP
tara:strand:+ start:1438 stop:1578 length:141 start_codon:yes stop_codon:yes gene_type:complete